MATLGLYLVFLEYPWYALSSIRIHASVKSMNDVRKATSSVNNYYLQRLKIGLNNSSSRSYTNRKRNKHLESSPLYPTKPSLINLKSSNHPREFSSVNAGREELNSNKAESSKLTTPKLGVPKIKPAISHSSNMKSARLLLSKLSPRNRSNWRTSQQENISSDYKEAPSQSQGLLDSGDKNASAMEKEAAHTNEMRKLKVQTKNKTSRVELCRNIRTSSTIKSTDQQEFQEGKSTDLKKFPRVNVLKSSFAITALTEILNKRLQMLNISAEAKQYSLKPWHKTCYNRFTLANSCDKEHGCLQKQLPQDTATRIRQLVNRSHINLNSYQYKLFQEMADAVNNTYDLIFLSAASNNHYLESQALLQNLHTNVFPFLKNFTFLFYDLGLTSEQRATFQRFCRCKVLDYDRSKFPEFAKDLKKFAWKPYLVKAHIHQARVLIWMDTSIRFLQNPSDLRKLFTEQIQKLGVMVGYSVKPDSCFTTCRSTYHRFGDEPCAYLGLPIFQASVLIFNNDPFVQRAIVEPWAACAFDETCIAPPEPECTVGCAAALKTFYSYQESRGYITYGQCHRFDQAVITLILHKLYLQYSPLLRVEKNKIILICRKDSYDYTSTLT